MCPGLGGYCQDCCGDDDGAGWQVGAATLYDYVICEVESMILSTSDLNCMVCEKGELMVCGWVDPITIERSATSSHMILTIDPKSV